jgi:hypothetical protein
MTADSHRISRDGGPIYGKRALESLILNSFALIRVICGLFELVSLFLKACFKCARLGTVLLAKAP